MDGDHGRIETRKYWITSDINYLQSKENWKKLSSIGVVERTREIGEHVSVEKHYYLTSLKSDAELFAKAVRNHWGIENGLHWTLDMAFREDECRIRKGYAPENFSVLRQMALNLLKSEKSFNGSINTKKQLSITNNFFNGRIIKRK